MTRAATVVLAFVLVAAIGCRSFVDDQAATSTYAILSKSVVAARRQPDVELARAALPGGIAQLQAFALAYPKHPEFRALYAESLCAYTSAFVFDDWEDAALARRDDDRARLAKRLTVLVGECVDASLDELPPEWRSARASGGDAWAADVRAATTADAHALLQIATADAISLAIDPIHHLGALATIDAELASCARVAPGANDAAAEILQGTLAAARARFMPAALVRGDADGASAFAHARTVGGDGLFMIDVMFARGVAVARGDHALFESTLRGVVAADLTRWPDRRLVNELAQIKARRYLAAEDALFASPQL